MKKTTFALKWPLLGEMLVFRDTKLVICTSTIIQFKQPQCFQKHLDCKLPSVNTLPVWFELGLFFLGGEFCTPEFTNPKCQRKNILKVNVYNSAKQNLHTEFMVSVGGLVIQPKSLKLPVSSFVTPSRYRTHKKR